MAEFVRFRSPTPNARGARVGVFALANGLAANGALTSDEAAWLRASNDWYNTACDEPSRLNGDVFSREVHPITECWFRSSAHALIERIDGYLRLLDAHGVPWERVESDHPGTIVYEDDVQIVVAALPVSRDGIGPPVEIRRCSAKDVAAISASEPPGANVAVQQFARQSRGESLYLVAWIGARPVGAGELVFGTSPELRNLHVSEDLRGQGIGSAILDAAERASAGSGTLSVGVGTENAGARRLYGRRGYVGTGELTTTTYTYFDRDGVERQATETDERMVKSLRVPPGEASPG